MCNSKWAKISSSIVLINKSSSSSKRLGRKSLHCPQIEIICSRLDDNIILRNKERHSEGKIKIKIYLFVVQIVEITYPKTKFTFSFKP